MAVTKNASKVSVNEEEKKICLLHTCGWCHINTDTVLRSITVNTIYLRKLCVYAQLEP